MSRGQPSRASGEVLAADYHVGVAAPLALEKPAPAAGCCARRVGRGDDAIAER